MNSPFPGIDPYLEDQGHWPDFHSTFLNCCREALFEKLPQNYDARIDERFRLVEVDDKGERSRLIEPDVAVVRRAGPPGPGAEQGGGVGLLLEPVIEPIGPVEVIEERLTWVEVRRLPGRELVTVIELLSPGNKTSPGREDYLSRRRALLNQEVHLVELDFLIGGRRLPPGDSYALVTRADRRPACEVYAWSVRQALPFVPVPLKAPDPDVMLDMLSVFRITYERGRYPRAVDYRAPLKLPFAEADRAWAEGRARSV
jgi:hypothetical protein